MQKEYTNYPKNQCKEWDLEEDKDVTQEDNVKDEMETSHQMSIADEINNVSMESIIEWI